MGCLGKKGGSMITITVKVDGEDIVILKGEVISEEEVNVTIGDHTSTVTLDQFKKEIDVVLNHNI